INTYGKGVGSTEVTITVTVDGIEVYNGPVSTQNGPIVNPPDPSTVLFSWQEDIAFEGTRALSITVNSGDMLLKTYSKANYCADDTGPLGPDVFYWLPDGPETVSVDPTSNWQMNGSPVSKPPDPSGGELWWNVSVGSTFSYNLRMNRGFEPKPLE
ncbi:MAG: hypothetical protein EBX50_15500, partial [Chitinophagia bacterium]|nr:hypothetical protein [Chitinophagia bacterium]